MKMTFNKILFIILTTLTIGCSKDDDFIVPKSQLKVEEPKNYTVYYSTPYSTTLGSPTIVTLYAADSIDIGTITVTNNNDSVFVTFNTYDNWQLQLIHLFVGSMLDIPLDPANNPYVNNFPYVTTLDPMQTTVTFGFPDSLLHETFIVAAYAEVYKVLNGQIIQSEIAWGEGIQFTEDGIWATYFNYSKKSQVSQITEFSIYTVYLVKVGKLQVSNDKYNMYVTYVMNTYYYMSQTNLYVGSLGGMPRNVHYNPDLGQFPYITTHNPMIDSYKYTISLNGLPQTIVIVAYTECYKNYNGTTGNKELAYSKGVQFPSGKYFGWYNKYFRR